MSLQSENITTWRVLFTAARTGSLTQTALVTDMTPAKVSKILMELEAEAGFPLFDRSRRPMKPTHQCRELIEAMTPIITGFERTWEEFSATSAKKHVNFAAPIDLCRLYFSAVLARWSDAHPGITFDIHPEATAEDVREGRIDVAIINYTPEDATNLILRRYNQSRTPLLATPKYLRAHGAPASPEDLIHHTGLLLETVMHPTTQTLWKDRKPSSMLAWKEVFITHDQMTLRELVLSSAGITCDLYAGHVIPEIKSGKLVPVLPGWRRAPWEMSVVTLWSAEASSKALADFATYLAEDAGRTWRAIREETDRTVDDAFRRRLTGGA